MTATRTLLVASAYRAWHSAGHRECARRQDWVSESIIIASQVAITATDLAEIIGSATAMYLLFGLPLWIGVLITAADVLFILFFGTHNFRLLEVGAAALVYICCGSAKTLTCGL